MEGGGERYEKRGGKRCEKRGGKRCEKRGGKKPIKSCSLSREPMMECTPKVPRTAAFSWLRTKSGNFVFLNNT
jgi:hypothetical protein